MGWHDAICYPAGGGSEHYLSLKRRNRNDVDERYAPVVVHLMVAILSQIIYETGQIVGGIVMHTTMIM